MGCKGSDGGDRAGCRSIWWVILEMVAWGWVLTTGDEVRVVVKGVGIKVRVTTSAV